MGLGADGEATLGPDKLFNSKYEGRQGMSVLYTEHTEPSGRSCMVHTVPAQWRKRKSSLSTIPVSQCR